jgi:hypothetical protein
VAEALGLRGLSLGSALQQNNSAVARTKDHLSDCSAGGGIRGNCNFRNFTVPRASRHWTFGPVILSTFRALRFFFTTPFLRSLHPSRKNCYNPSR